MVRDHEFGRLVASFRRVLEAYKDERQALFECFADEHGEIDCLERQLLISIMDDNIEDAEAALAPFATIKRARA